MMNLLCRQIGDDGRERYARRVIADVARIEGEINSGTGMHLSTRLWFEGERRATVWTEVPASGGRIEIEAI